jgi:hypothetical protein
MFSELPKLFDRDFAIGFFLPSAVFCGAGWGLLSIFFDIGTPDFEKLTSTAIAVGIVWLVAVGMLATNYPLLRLLEGYPAWNIFKQRKKIWLRRFRREAQPVLRLQTEIDAAIGGQLPYIPPSFDEKLRLAIERYPHAEKFVLPTEFGNIFRALEVYSFVVYGLDAVPAWPRLLAILPDSVKKQLSEAKAMIDFFVNVFSSSVIIIMIFSSFSLWTSKFHYLWIPALTGFVGVASYRLSLVALRQYGDHVKSVFDLHRGELAESLGLKLPGSAEAERLMWGRVNSVMIYRSSNDWDRLAPFRQQPEQKSAE